MPPVQQSAIRPIFAVPMMSHQWDDVADLNRDLLATIFGHEKNSDGQAKTNVGGWQSSEDLQNWAGPAGEKLLQMIIELANHATSQFFDAEGISEEFTWGIALWANVNRNGHFNRMHIHAGSTWSGVYYVDVGDGAGTGTGQHGGTITFVNPNLAAATSFFTQATVNQNSIAPASGEMLLFPSYLQHYVEPYWGQRPRVTIAFNLRKQPFP